MTFGEKLQQLRKARGLSQEQLSAQLAVSRQAVSKWELNEAMPDTDNVIQLARIFKVSTDYLLLDEQDLPAAQPAAKRADPRAAPILGLAACAVGLLLAAGGWLREQTIGPLVVGLIIQVLGVALFELQTAHMPPPGSLFAARAKFYAAACWLIVPILMAGLCQALFVLLLRPAWGFAPFFILYPLVCAAVTVILTVLRRRHAS